MARTVRHFRASYAVGEHRWLQLFTGPRDYRAAKKEIEAAGYKGENVVLVAPTDLAVLKALADVGSDMMQKIGLNVEYQAMDWGTVVQRCASMKPLDQSGSSLFHTFWSGLDQANPVGHGFLRGSGKAAAPGWPISPKIEALRMAWINARDVAAQSKIAVELQLQALIDLPYVPLGQMCQPTSFHVDISGVLAGFAIFWNVRRV